MPIGTYYAINLCIGLYKFNITMWKQTICNQKSFKQLSNKLPFRIDLKNIDISKNDVNWSLSSSKDHHDFNARYYDLALQYAQNNPVWNSFRL